MSDAEWLAVLATAVGSLSQRPPTGLRIERAIEQWPDSRVNALAYRRSSKGSMRTAVLSWSSPGSGAVSATIRPKLWLCVELEEETAVDEEPKTRVVLTHSGLVTAAVRERNDGWPLILRLLKSYVEEPTQ